MASNITISSRAEQLKLMDLFVHTFNDEDLVEPWLMNGIPDGSDESDYRMLAEDAADYNDIFNLFVRLVQRNGTRY